MVDYTWPAKACPCGSCQCAECQENDCEWVLDPSLVPVALRTTKPGVLEYESWSAVSGVAIPFRTHTTDSGESLCGIAIRQLGNERRWTEIRDLNADRFPDMLGSDYYPVGTVIKLPPKEQQ